MNIYLKRLKQALTEYYAEALKADEEKTKALVTYNQDIAAQQRDKIDSELYQKKLETIQAFENTLADFERYVESWGTLDGNKIDEADAKLLKLDLPKEEFARLVEKHNGNGTMCLLLAQYAEKHNLKNTENAFKMGDYVDVIIPTKESKKEAFQFFYNSALSTIENMSGFGWGAGVDSIAVQSSVQNFGEPNPINYKALEILGG